MTFWVLAAVADSTARGARRSNTPRQAATGPTLPTNNANDALGGSHTRTKPANATDSSVYHNASPHRNANAVAKSADDGLSRPPRSAAVSASRSTRS